MKEFLLRDGDRALPVWLDGTMRIVRWGNRRGLPCTAWTRLATLEGGGWNEPKAEPVVIAACMGLDRGVWFHVPEGVLGVALHDERGTRWSTSWSSLPRSTTR